jgi:hypothetical protein
MYGVSILKPIVDSENIKTSQASEFFKILAKQGKLKVRLNSLNKTVAVRVAKLHEDIENPSTRSGKSNFFCVEASFPLALAKRAQIAELFIEEITLAKNAIKDVGRIENNRMILSWRIKIK